MAGIKLSVCVFGIGKQGQKIVDTIIANDIFKIKYLISRKENLQYNIPIYNSFQEDIEVNGAIIVTPPDTHYKCALPFLKKGIKVFVEKPLRGPEYNKATKLAEREMFDFEDNVMVGNKFLYSTPFIKLKKHFISSNIEIYGMFSQWIKKANIKSPGIFFDLAYHHIYLSDFFMGSKNRTIKCIGLKENGWSQSGIVLIDYGNLKKSFVEVSFRNHIDHFKNSIRLETSVGAYIMSEQFGLVNVSLPSPKNFEAYICDGLKNELIVFKEWILGTNKPKDTFEENIEMLSELNK